MKKTYLKTLVFSILLISVEAHALTNPVILYVGDSHSYGKLGTTIEKNLSEVSKKVVMHASCGATPNTWLGNLKYERTNCGYWMKEGKEEVRLKEHLTPKFKDELSRVKPDVTVIQLGTNIAYGKLALTTKNSIEMMMKAATDEGSACVWVGPPDANSKLITKVNVIEVSRVIEELAKKNGCEYIDSLKLTKFPKGNSEGIHYPPGLSAEWGMKVSGRLLNIIATLKK